MSTYEDRLKQLNAEALRNRLSGKGFSLVAQRHNELFDALVDAGHDVDLWADDPSMLRAYAEAVGFVVGAP